MTRAELNIAWCEAHLHLPEGKFVGQPLKMAEFMQDDFRAIYDNVHGTRRAIISRGRKNAKGLALDTPIATPRGWSTMGALKVGDEVFDERGRPSRVTTKSPVHIGLRCWRLRFADGSEIVADEQHQWLTKHRGDKRSHWGVVTTPEIAASLYIQRPDGVREHGHKVAVAAALETPEAALPLPPYVLGYWLGNGATDGIRVTSGLRDCADIFEELEQELGYVPRLAWGMERGASNMTLSRGRSWAHANREQTAIHHLRALGVLGDKHIPDCYKFASREQRLALLQGLMDSDGSTSRGTGTPRCEFANTNGRLVRDVLFLARSLGFKASLNEGRAKLGGRDLGPAWKVGFCAYREDEVFRLGRKRERLLARPSKPGRSASNAIVACDEVASVPTVCIAVDSPSHLFLAGEALTPTHNTTECACILLLHLCGPEHRINSQMYSAAQSRDQAAVLFSLAAKIVRLSSKLQPVIQIRDTVKELLCPQLGTSYKALSAEASTAYGLSPALTVFDELGQERGERSELYEVLETATAAQENPLTIVISTQAPSDQDFLSVLIDDALAGHDPTVVLRFNTAPDDVDPFSEETIRLANPAYDVFMNRKEVLAMAADASRMPARKAAFRNLVLNQRVSAENHFLAPPVWDACAEPPIDLEGREVYGGLDLSATTDLTALVLIGRNIVDGVWSVVPTFWLPSQGLAEKAKHDRVPYDDWAERGFLLTSPGASISYEYIAAYLWREVFPRYRVVKIGFDRWNFGQLRPWLVKAGFSETVIKDHFIEYGQGTQSMSPPLRQLESLVLDCKLRHGGHPVLKMCCANSVVEGHDESNRRLSKKRSNGRIDGMVALAMAIGVAPLGPSKIDIFALIG